MTGTTVTLLVIAAGLLVVAALGLRQSMGRLTSDVHAHMSTDDPGLPRRFAAQQGDPVASEEPQGRERSDLRSSDAG